MKKIHFREWTVPSSRYWAVFAVLAAIVGIGLIAAIYMEHEGHWVTGMNNQIIWGMPHVFAVFLIVAASGALNVATIGTVFGKKPFKPLGRLSGLLAISLLAGGLLVLVLDLGRADRLMVAMTTYNFKSIFAWNILLYNGFFVIVAVYLYTMMEPKAKKYYFSVGVLGGIWRLILTTGTGSIFGFLVARQAYDTAILAPLFIVYSFAFGLAIFMLFLFFAFDQDNRELGDKLLFRMKNVLGIFLAGVALLLLTYHLTKLYGTKYHGVEAFILRDGGIYTVLFWVGQVAIGMLLPIAIIIHPVLSKSKGWLSGAAAMVVVGGLAAMYVIIIGGQAYPLEMFPGKTIIASGFYDGVNGAALYYSPSMPEILLGVGGFSMAILATTIGVRMLKFLPTDLSDRALDPHTGVKADG